MPRKKATATATATEETFSAEPLAAPPPEAPTVSEASPNGGGDSAIGPRGGPLPARTVVARRSAPSNGSPKMHLHRYFDHLGMTFDKAPGQKTSTGPGESRLGAVERRENLEQGHPAGKREVEIRSRRRKAVLADRQRNPDRPGAWTRDVFHRSLKRLAAPRHDVEGVFSAAAPAGTQFRFRRGGRAAGRRTPPTGKAIMRYKTIVLEFLQAQYPGLHEQLRASRTLLQAVNDYATALRTLHQGWMEEFRPGEAGLRSGPDRERGPGAGHPGSAGRVYPPTRRRPTRGRSFPWTRRWPSSAESYAARVSGGPRRSAQPVLPFLLPAWQRRASADGPPPPADAPDAGAAPASPADSLPPLRPRPGPLTTAR